MKRVLVVMLFLFNFISAQEVLDKIIAIVDNEAILKSEFEISVLRYAAQRNLDPSDAKFRKEVLNALIDEKLLYAQAELDSIVISEDELKQRLEQTINYYIQQYGSEDAIEKTFGMNIEKIKRELRDDTKKSLMADRVQQKKFNRIECSVREVEEFFKGFADSLGVIPERYKVAHIFINPKSSDRVKIKARQFAEQLLDSIKKGADFATLAKAVSDDPGSAARGGELGWAKRGKFYPEFEAAAFALKDNEISPVIETPVGYHIIQLQERRGESVRSRHILIKPKSDDQTELESIQFLSDIRDSIMQKKNGFDYYAKKHSNDEQTAMFGGEMGTFELNQLDNNLKDVVFKLKEGDISFPKRIQLAPGTFGYHIVKLIKKTFEHKPSIDQDYEDIKKIAEYQKKQKLYKEWLAELRSKIFWEIKE